MKRIGHDVPMETSRDHWYHDLCALPIANGKCPTEVMDAEDPLYILYTSGSTGKPKAVLHTHGGYMVGIYSSLKYVFDVNDEDRWWCAADPGWVTGHSYIVYGPLLTGATSFMFEGGPTYPYPNRWWQCVEKYGITIPMWLMLQQPAPDDYVVASGKAHSVREFVDTAFSLVGLDYRRFVRTDPSLFRPSEVVQLCGDPAKAESRLGWKRTLSFPDIIRTMVEQELASHEKRPC